MITTRQKLTRYSASLAIVLGVHAVAIAVALNWSSPQLLELPPQAMVIEMAPLPAPPPPPQVVTPPTPPTPVEEPELPKVAEAPKPVISVPKPQPKPKPKPQPPKPKPEVKQPPREEPPAEKTVDTPPSEAPPAKSAAPAPAPSPPSNSNALPTWQSDLLQHLAKYKKYPDNARRLRQEGTVRLRFVVDADGKVLSYSIAESSGSAALDRATMEMIRRAQPLPKPPAELMQNGSKEVIAPFSYTLDKRR